MDRLTIGVIIVIISLLGYASNWINWRFLNYKINYLLYYFGAFIHESSHALGCLITGAKITEYKVLVRQPRVSYSNSKVPVIGDLIISIAPMFGGLVFLYFFNRYFLASHFIMPQFSSWKLLLPDFLKLIRQINLTQWKDICALFLFLNIGAMIGPSWQDLKNVWLLIIVFMFIPWPFFTHLGLLSIALIIINIIFQIILAAIIFIAQLLYKTVKRTRG